MSGIDRSGRRRASPRSCSEAETSAPDPGLGSVGALPSTTDPRLERLTVATADAERRLHEAEIELKASREALARTRMQLIQSEKLGAVGRLAAGVAHEVKNPLSVLMMGMDLLSRQMSSSTGPTAEVLKAMRHAAERAEAIVRGLVNFSACGEMKSKVQDLNKVVDDSLLMVRHEIMAAHLQLVKDLQPGLPPVALDGAKIEQVLVNVLLNAIQAMSASKGAKLAVRTFLKEDRDGAGVATGGRALVIEIDDSGTGIPPDKLPRLFEPFFTTKPLGQGTGLGLSVSRQIMELHGGGLSIGNREEGGARVTITINA